MLRKLFVILRVILALGYTPITWRLIRATFIPKSGEIGQDSAGLVTYQSYITNFKNASRSIIVYSRCVKTLLQQGNTSSYFSGQWRPNSSLKSIVQGSSRRGIDETSWRWTDCVFRERLIYMTIWGK